MNIKTIFRNVGSALLVSALFMFLSVLVSINNGNDSALAPLAISFIITFTFGIFPFIFVRRTSEITLKEGYLVVVLSWLLSFIFGMLPYALWGGPFDVVNAWFESVSGFTTTGSTILDDIEALPKSLLFWRSSTHFIGGLGVVVFLLLVIPRASSVRFKLTNMEVSSLSRDSYNSRTNKTVYIFAYVYIGIFIAAFLSFWAAGMSAFDAVCHAFSVCATGGFSTRNESLAAFDSRLIEGLSMFFEVLASLHFGLLFLTIAKRSLKPLNNAVLKFYLGSLALFSVLIGLSLKLQGAVPSWQGALWEGAYQTISIASTTGLAPINTASWSLLPCFLLAIMAIMCGCAGSTTGGLKADRVLVLFKAIHRQIRKVLHPSAVNEVRLGANVIRDEEVYPMLLYVGLYFLVLVVSVLLCSLSGMNGSESLVGSLASLSNVGQAVGDANLENGYNCISDAGKMVLTLDMFFGRIEFYPLLAVVAMIFSRKTK